MFRLLIIAVSIAAVSSSFHFSLWPFNIGWTATISEQDVEKSIPYMVSLMYNETYMCSGAIINKRAILTAGHCLLGVNKDVAKIGVGLKYRKSHDDLISIKNWTIHENFNYTNLENDIAIVFLAEDIPLKNGKIELIAMAEHNSEINNAVEGVIGCWEPLEKTKPEKEILKVSSSPIVTLKVCSKLVINEISKRNICAGKFDGSVNECQQDSGSPLVIQNKLVGIASWGYGCIKFEEPVVYTKISEFRDWIDNQIKM